VFSDSQFFRKIFVWISNPRQAELDKLVSVRASLRKPAA
jgi:hypothetical protein